MWTSCMLARQQRTVLYMQNQHILVQNKGRMEGVARVLTYAQGTEDCLLSSWPALTQCKAVAHEPLDVSHLLLHYDHTSSEQP